MDEINKIIWETKYNNSGSLDTLNMTRYGKQLIEIRFDLIKRYGYNKVVLDLCCGTGEYLVQDVFHFKKSIGIDFSRKMLNLFRQKFGNNLPENLEIISADARKIPLENSSSDLIYSFCSLYYVPHVDIAIKEIGRVLRPGGVAVLELGNLWSFNTLFSEFHYRKDGWAKPFHIGYFAMQNAIKEAGLDIIEHHSFHFFPFFGIPFTHWNVFETILGIKIGGKMVDEWISNLWPIRYIAFRHIFVCKKEE